MKRPTERQYRNAEIETAMIFAPEISPCDECGWPKTKGNVCLYCRDRETNEIKEQNAP